MKSPEQASHPLAALTMLDPLRSEPALIDQVYDQLVEAISDGSLRPGERLTQERVARLLDVSRQPVSHALQLLKHRGLLIEHGRKGLAVAPLDGTRIWHLYQVRESMDGLAARLASERVASGQVHEADINVLHQILQAGCALDESAETIELVRADVTFHLALHDLSGNPEIARTVSEQWPQFMRSMAVVLETKARRSLIWKEHTAIVDAVLAGDAPLAEHLSGKHAHNAGEESSQRICQMCKD